MKYFLLKLKRVLLQFLFLLACYFVSRCFFAAINRSHFDNLDVPTFLSIALRALRFDTSAILVINALYLFLFFLPVNLSIHPRWEKVTQFIFILLNSVAFLFEISDWAYFSFTLKRSTSDVLDMVTRKGDFLSLLPHFIVDYWYVPVAVVLYIATLIFVNRQIRKSTPLQNTTEPHSWAYKGVLVLELAVIGGLSVIGIRGGITNYVPIGVRDAVTVRNASYVPVVLNTPFSIINTLSSNRLMPIHYMSEDGAAQYINTTKNYNHSSFQKKNVVVIILESFSKEFTCLGKVHGYTPFLDSLMGNAYTCTSAYANALHSAEGIPAVVAGIPSVMEEPFATSVYGTDKITSLPGLLRREGYATAFYHGGTNGTMSFDLFCANAGFEHYYGRREYNNEADYDGNWGIWDEPFLQYFAKGMSNMPQPFFTTVFTLSSHDPFRVPARYKSKLPHGKLRIEATIAYTDMALREFFQTASKQSWFDNTLFVITADHSALVHEEKYYTKNMGAYAIPILFYDPGNASLKGFYTNATQQIDILPSVMDYLGYNHSFFAFGNSIFSGGQNFAVNTFQGKNQLLMDGYLLQTVNLIPQGLYNFSTDSNCRNNILNNKDVQSVNATGLGYLKAFTQVVNNALINNKMWINN